MVFKTQVISALDGDSISIENLMDDFSETEKDSKEGESKFSKIMEDQKWVSAFVISNRESLSFSNYISSASLKGLPSVSFEIETPPPDTIA
jgi:hypothetical protein